MVAATETDVVIESRWKQSDQWRHDEGKGQVPRHRRRLDFSK